MDQQVPLNLNDEDAFHIEFTNPKGGSLGRFSFSKDKCEFVGATDECAKQFVEAVRKEWLVPTPKP